MLYSLLPRTIPAVCRCLAMEFRVLTAKPSLSLSLSLSLSWLLSLSTVCCSGAELARLGGKIAMAHAGFMIFQRKKRFTWFYRFTHDGSGSDSYSGWSVMGRAAEAQKDRNIAALTRVIRWDPNSISQSRDIFLM